MAATANQVEPHVLVFVFGTLKKGFPLHNRGLSEARLIGAYRTQERFPLVIAGPWFAPMMFNEPGEGHHILGEVYQVDVAQLATLDRIESVGKPGNCRLTIDLEAASSGGRVSAFGYMKSREIAQGIYHSGYLESYHDHRFVPIEAR